MERLTHRGPDGIPLAAPETVLPTEQGWTGPALERLAAFEDLCLELEEEQRLLSAQLEELRLAGKKNSVKFRELLGKKLMGSSMLTRLRLRELL